MSRSCLFDVMGYGVVYLGVCVCGMNSQWAAKCACTFNLIYDLFSMKHSHDLLYIVYPVAFSNFFTVVHRSHVIVDKQW